MFSRLENVFFYHLKFFAMLQNEKFYSFVKMYFKLLCFTYLQDLFLKKKTDEFPLFLDLGVKTLLDTFYNFENIPIFNQKSTLRVLIIWKQLILFKKCKVSVKKMFMLL